MSNLRRLVKRGMAAVLSRTGANAVLSGLIAGRQPLVLGYHSVVEDVRAHEGRAIPANLISVGMLERQLDWIARRYRFLTPDELGAHLESGAPFSRPSALVTFDDGYAGVYEHAFPLLKRKGIPAGIFVVTGNVGSPQLQIYDHLYLLLTKALPAIRYSLPRFTVLLENYGVRLASRPPLGSLEDVFTVMRGLYTTCDQHSLRRAIEAFETIAHVDDRDYPELRAMTWDMVLELDRGGMTIGSHTHTHALLTIEDPHEVVRQLAVSSETLQRKLGRPAAHFAYPDGRFDPGIVSAVAEARYRFAYTICLHRDPQHPRLTIPRKLLWEQSCLNGDGGFSADLMSCHAAGVFDRIAPCGQDHRRAGQRAAAPTNGPAPMRFEESAGTHQSTHAQPRAGHV